jgi:hypothetical protein
VLNESIANGLAELETMLSGDSANE